MFVTFATADGRIAAAEVDAEETIDHLRAIVEVHLGLPMAEQRWMWEGRPLDDLSRTLGRDSGSIYLSNECVNWGALRNVWKGCRERSWKASSGDGGWTSHRPRMVRGG